jgi:hypothetical protein
MKHLKKQSVPTIKNQVSDDMKKQDHVKPPKAKKLDGEKHLSKDELPKKSQKPSNKKLDGEKFLSKTEKEGSSRKPSNNKLDGEKFLSDDDKVEKVPEKVFKHLKKFNVEERTEEGMSNIKTFEYYYFGPRS